jgi:hypothetical protein
MQQAHFEVKSCSFSAECNSFVKFKRICSGSVLQSKASAKQEIEDSKQQLRTIEEVIDSLEADVASDDHILSLASNLSMVGCACRHNLASITQMCDVSQFSGKGCHEPEDYAAQ